MKFIYLILISFVIAGCINSQPEAKDCGYAYQECLSPAEGSCTPAFGKLDNGAVIMAERIIGPEGDNCKIDMRIEAPDSVKGLSASCKIPQGVIISAAHSGDTSYLCIYCTGTMIDKFKSIKFC